MPDSTLHPFAPLPAFKRLQDYVQAAASGSRDSLYHLVCVIFTLTRAVITTLAHHYQAHPLALTPSIVARLKYCAVRLHAILYTLQHAPERFFTPAQLRALTRARAVLSHMCHESVDFSPLAPVLASAACAPSLPRSGGVSSSSQSLNSLVAQASTPSHTPAQVHRSSAPLSSAQDAPHDATASSSPNSPSSADPRLLRNPGCALATVLLHIAAIYRVPASPVLSPRTSASPAAPHGPTNAIPDSPAQSAIQSENLNIHSSNPNPFSAHHPPP